MYYQQHYPNVIIIACRNSLTVTRRKICGRNRRGGGGGGGRAGGGRRDRLWPRPHRCLRLRLRPGKLYIFIIEIGVKKTLSQSVVGVASLFVRESGTFWLATKLHYFVLAQIIISLYIRNAVLISKTPFNVNHLIHLVLHLSLVELLINILICVLMCRLFLHIICHLSYFTWK